MYITSYTYINVMNINMMIIICKHYIYYIYIGFLLYYNIK